ncbi:regulator of G-protein signaling [Seiridium cupressi]
MSRSRPTSLAFARTSSPGIKFPSLGEILSNTAPPPWTLSAFTAYLSQNHCLETLEFLMEAERFRKAHQLQSTIPARQLQFDEEDVCSLWHKIMQAYIMPYSPREVNIPAPVRDRLLELKCSNSTVPQPSELNEAVSIVHELMIDSLLFPFFQSVTNHIAEAHNEEAMEERKSRSRLRIPRDLISSPDEGSQSPKTSFLPLLLGRSSPVANRSASGSGSGSGFDLMEMDLVADDSSSPNTTPGAEPMTPPTTPPTSECTFNTSPNTLQRAITGNSWKRMGARLGLSKKSRSIRRSQPTNIPATSAMTEPLSSTTCDAPRDSPRSSWEDPHPGERVPIDIGAPSDFCGYPHAINDNVVSGVAAKAVGVQYNTRPLVRKSVRTRQRSTMPKPLKIPAEVPEEPESKSAPLYMPQPINLIAPFPPMRLPYFPKQEPLRPMALEVDMDAQTEVGIPLDEVEVDDIKMVETSSFTDLSSFLDVSNMDEDYDNTSVTVIGSDTYSATQSSEDLYGWEAELDRKVKCGIMNTDVCKCDEYEYRRANGSRRGLLHRVFSSGRKPT